MWRKIKRVIVAQLTRVVYFKISGRQVFINKVTVKLPLYSQLIKKLESRLHTLDIWNQREIEYKKWFKKNYPSKKLLSAQKKTQAKFKKRPKISILVPTYNTEKEHLKACLDSVINQSYSNWELCIADDASTDETVKEVVNDYQKRDKRVKYVFRDKNGHISRASNSALKLATGEFVALLDHDDIIWPNALHEVVKRINEKPKTDFLYSDEDKLEEHKHVDPFFKPDWSPEFLRSINYITHFSVIRRSLVEKVGGFRVGFEGTQDWDLFLRISRETDKIEHIPTILYSWRKTEQSTAMLVSAKNYAYDNQKKALADDVRSRGYKAKITHHAPTLMWDIKYELKNKYKVSIIIPTKDQFSYIKRCLLSIKEKMGYSNFEIVVVDTGSSDTRVWDLYKRCQDFNFFKEFKVVKWRKKFNFASVCNFGAKEASGDFYLFLNNDTEVISSDWIEFMLGYAQQKEIGMVGCRLLYPDKKLQHAGIILGVGGQNNTPGIAGHFFPGFREKPPEDPKQPYYVGGTRNFMAVTAACVMVSKEKFNQVKGFEDKYRIAFNDVDLCLKIGKAGYRNVYLPRVKLYHYESISVGQPGSKVRDIVEFKKEIDMMLASWRKEIENDPYYHPEFRRDIASARLKV